MGPVWFSPLYNFKKYSFRINKKQSLKMLKNIQVPASYLILDNRSPSRQHALYIKSVITKREKEKSRLIY